MVPHFNVFAFDVFQSFTFPENNELLFERAFSRGQNASHVQLSWKNGSDLLLHAVVD